MASKAATTATKNTTRWLWPSIAMASIGAFAWSNMSNYQKYTSSLQELQTQIVNLRQIINAQNHSLQNQRSLSSSSNIDSNTTKTISATSKVNGNSYSDIIRAISPSIVNLVIESEITQNFGFFQIQQPTKQLGTGVIIRSDGIIITNNHVVTTPDFKDDQEITVYLSNSRKVQAHILLKDELNDLALLKIDSDNDEIFPFIEINNTHNIKVGDRVLAIGNNLGLHNTVTDGIISAIGRAQASQIHSDDDTYSQQQSQLPQDMSAVKISKNPYLPFLQTNAAINQGSSGGALIDATTKQLIGINTAIASPIGLNIGIGFSIPSSYVLAMLRSLESSYKKRVLRPWDGLDVNKQVIDIKYLSKETLDKLNEKMNTTHSFYIEGVEVLDMHKQSGAKQCGIEEGDVLIMINDNIEIDSPDKYWMTLNGFVPNQIVKYLVLRVNDGSTGYELLEFDVKISNPPEPTSDDVRIRDSRNVLNGCSFGELQPALGIELGINACKEGVMLMEMPYSSIAAHSGFKAGDLLLEIDGVEIENVEHLNDLNLSRSVRHNIVIQRGDMVGEINL